MSVSGGTEFSRPVRPQISQKDFTIVVENHTLKEYAKSHNVGKEMKVLMQ